MPIPDATTESPTTKTQQPTPSPTSGACPMDQYKTELDICKPLTTCAETQFESTSATASSDRACNELVVCEDQQYELSVPTTTSNRECAPHTLCDLNTQFQAAPGTTMTDTTCNPLTTCTKAQYQTGAPTETSDRICANLRVCTDAEYQGGVQENGDRDCKALTICGSSQFESVASTALTDRGCEDEIVCTNKQTKQGTGKGAMCVSSKFVPQIIRVQVTLQVSGVDAPTPKQTTTVQMRIKVNIYAEEAFWGFDAENETEKSSLRVTSGSLEVQEAYRGPHETAVLTITMLELTPGPHTIHVVDTYMATAGTMVSNLEGGGRQLHSSQMGVF